MGKPWTQERRAARSKQFQEYWANKTPEERKANAKGANDSKFYERPEWRERQSKSHTGKKQSGETKQKRSKSLKVAFAEGRHSSAGYFQRPEVQAKAVANHFKAGEFHHTPETIAKIRASKAGLPNPMQRPEVREKISGAIKAKWQDPVYCAKMTGEAANGYRNGESREPYPCTFGPLLKADIRKRDNDTCQECRMTEAEHQEKYGKHISVHHIDYQKANLADTNLITLCISCNTKANRNRPYWETHFKEKLARGP